MNKKINRLTLGVMIGFLTVSQLTTLSKPAFAGQGYCNSGRWWKPNDCVFPTQAGVSYLNLKSITVNGGSGANIGFRNNSSGGTVWKHANLNETVTNPSPSSYTDVFISVDNRNWFTGFSTNF